MASMKLKRLKIDQYRNVAPGTELVFNDTWNVLLGQNGTGKTTLLNLIAMVVASDFSPLKEEAFAIEYALSFTDGSSITVWLQNTPQEDGSGQQRVAFEPASGEVSELPSSQVESLSWRCLVTVRLAGCSEHWEVASNPIAATIARVGQTEPPKSIRNVSPFEEMFVIAALYRIDYADDLDANLQRTWSLLSQAILRAGSNSARFDEGLSVFNAVTGIHPTDQHDRLHPSSVVFQIIKPPSIKTKARTFRTSGIVPRDVIQRIKLEVPGSSRAKQDTHDESPDFTKRAAQVLGFTNLELTWDLQQKELGRALDRYIFGNFGFRLFYDDGSIINHTLLSYGQKRLLAFFYYLAANPDIAIADELVNGLHYDWIEVCLKEIGDRQSFLTSQNPLLLDFLPFTSAEDVQRSFLLCRREKRDGKHLMVWSNLDEESARSFFRAYETEAQQVSEILRSKGLW